MAAVLFIRIKSHLDPDEMDRRMLERRLRYRDVPGLLQKLYGRDESTGDICGIYLFETRDALDAFRDSELAHAITMAYEATGVRLETYDMLYSAYPDRGPAFG